MKKNILHVVNVDFVIPYYFGNQFRYFKDKNYTFHIASSKSDKFLEYSIQYDFIPFQTTISRNFNIFTDIKALYDIMKYIKLNNIDIIIGHTPKGALLAMLSGFLTGINNRIYYRHGLMFETSKNLKLYILRNVERFTGYLATKVVCVSPSVLSKTISYSLNHNSKNILFHKGTCNGIDINKFKKNNYIEKNLKILYNLNDDKIIIGYVGRLVKDKGIHELLEAWKNLLLKYNNIILLLVGPIEDRNQLSKVDIEYIKNEDSILNIGLVQNVVNFYNIMDIFILPSYREGFPTVILEASAMELPIITTRSTGCVDSIIEDETGVYTNIDSNNIENKIIYYINNPDLREKHGKNGLNFVQNSFKQEIIWDIIEKKIFI